jgi:fructose/tagatose bisphosphate aldolase
VEGECTPLPGAGSGNIDDHREEQPTSVDNAEKFVADTEVDAFAVNIGQKHLHARKLLDLDIDLLYRIRERIRVPLVLHGGSSVSKASIRGAIEAGIRKINIGSILKQRFLEEIVSAISPLEFSMDSLMVSGYNPYELIGSGFSKDILTRGRLAVQRQVESLMQLFGSTGKG